MKRFLLVAIFCLVNWQSFANEKSQYITKDFFDTVVNWSLLQISLNVSEKLPRVIIDTEDSEYGKERIQAKNSCGKSTRIFKS